MTRFDMALEISDKEFYTEVSSGVIEAILFCLCKNQNEKYESVRTVHSVAQ